MAFKKLDHLIHIQIFRAVALILVVFYHLKFPFFQNGFLGVDIFFVISGYLMVGSSMNITPIKFYKKRIDRLWRPYIFTIMFSLFVGIYLLGYSDFLRLSTQAIYGIFFSSNLFFWQEASYFKDLFNPLLHLWSLGVEAQFYLLVPFIYPLLLKNIKYMYLAIIIGFLLCLTALFISPKTSFYILPFRIWEFLIGAAIAFFPRPSEHNLLMQSLLPMILTACILFFSIQPDAHSIIFGHPGFASFIVCFLTALIIHFGIPDAFCSSFGGKVMNLLGEYSYSIYLVHFPVIIFMNYEIFNGNITGYNSYIDLITIIFFIGILSYFSYNFLEKKRSLSLFFPFKLASISVVFFLALFGAELNKTKFSKNELRIFQALESKENSRCGIPFRLLQPFTQICKLNNVNDSKRVLLVGNSHANAIKDTFNDSATKSDVTLYFYARNDPLLSETLSSQDIINDALELDIDLIVLHYQNLYKREFFKRELSKLLQLGEEKEVFIAIISPVPSHYESVPAMTYRALELNALPNLPSFTHYHSNLEDFYSVVKNNASKFLEIYPTDKFFCDEGGFCHAFSSHFRPYYYDKNHLTSIGSKKLSPLFDDLLNHPGLQ